MRKISLICLLFLLSVGCATIKTSDDVFLQSSVDVDRYQRTTWIKSPMSRKGYTFDYYDAFLRAFVDDKSVAVYQFYISDLNYNDWRFFDRAYDSDGNKLDFVEIDHQVTSSAGMREDFALNLSREYLDRKKSTGLNIKAVGKRGEKIFVLPGYYVEGFLKKIDKYTGKQ